MCEHTDAMTAVADEMEELTPAEADRVHDQAMREIDALEEECAVECHGIPLEDLRRFE